MTNFYFIRHCESESNTQSHLIGGRSNRSPVTERGRLQATQLGDYLTSHDAVFDLAFSSGAVRTNTTAKIALAHLQPVPPLSVDTRLLELSQGEFEGTRRDTVYTPSAVEHYKLSTLYGKFPGGESIHDAQTRMQSFISEKHQAHDGKTIAVFSHGLAIRALCGLIENLNKQQILALETANVSVTHIQFIDDSPVVHYVGKRVIPE